MLKIEGLKYGNLRRIEKGGLLWIGLMGILATGKAQQLPVDMERPVDAAGEVAVDRSALVVPDALPLFLVLTGDDSFGARRQNPDAWLEFRKTHDLPFSAAAEALACVRDTTKNGTMAPDIQVHRNLSWSTGSSEFFTGEVRVQRFEAPAPARVRASKVTFAPGARTAWHSHPLGQILIVTEGRGLVQRWGGAIQEILPGDVVWIPPGVKHWHGATPNAPMTHIAIVEALEGEVVTWMELVTEAQYLGQ